MADRAREIENETLRRIQAYYARRNQENQARAQAQVSRPSLPVDGYGAIQDALVRYAMARRQGTMPQSQVQSGVPDLGLPSSDPRQNVDLGSLRPTRQLETPTYQIPTPWVSPGAPPGQPAAAPGNSRGTPPISAGSGRWSTPDGESLPEASFTDPLLAPSKPMLDLGGLMAAASGAGRGGDLTFGRSGSGRWPTPDGAMLSAPSPIASLPATSTPLQGPGALSENRMPPPQSVAQGSPIRAPGPAMAQDAPSLYKRAIGLLQPGQEPASIAPPTGLRQVHPWSPSADEWSTVRGLGDPVSRESMDVGRGSPSAIDWSAVDQRLTEIHEETSPFYDKSIPESWRPVAPRKPDKNEKAKYDKDAAQTADPDSVPGQDPQWAKYAELMRDKKRKEAELMRDKKRKEAERSIAESLGSWTPSTAADYMLTGRGPEQGQIVAEGTRREIAELDDQAKGAKITSALRAQGMDVPDMSASEWDAVGMPMVRMQIEKQKAAMLGYQTMAELDKDEQAILRTISSKFLSANKDTRDAINQTMKARELIKNGGKLGPKIAQSVMVRAADDNRVTEADINRVGVNYGIDGLWQKMAQFVTSKSWPGWKAEADKAMAAIQQVNYNILRNSAVQEYEAQQGIARGEFGYSKEEFLNIILSPTERIMGLPDGEKVKLWNPETGDVHWASREMIRDPDFNLPLIPYDPMEHGIPANG